MKSDYNILIVEDEPQIAKILKTYLSIYKEFKNIVIAGNGVEAMQKITNQDFDLILTDIVMDKRDGLKFIEGLRKQPKYFNQKIIVVSGCLTAEMTMACMRKGVRHIVVKPFTAKQVLMKAVQALEITKKAEPFVEKIIAKVTERLMEDKERMSNAIADDEVMKMINSAKSKS
ncbi:MAG: response regulator [Bacteriovoracaceae bacterium]|nr:response regulator [Bacteriovoracaceae bacterium]